jgi:hypothetical protein
MLQESYYSCVVFFKESGGMGASNGKEKMV